MTRAIQALSGFRRCGRGATAVEFGLLAPLVLLLLLVGIDLGRAYQAQRAFEGAVTGLARLLASYPEYDSRVRAYAVPIAAELLPPDGDGKFNLKVTSLQKKEGAMVQVFPPHVLIGSDPKLADSATVAASKFLETEPVIQLSASYTFVPLLLPSSVGFTMTKTYVVTPYFSRKYERNEGQSPDSYVY